MREYLRRKRGFILIGLAVFLSMLLLNFMTPMVYDDYTYIFSFATGERITSIWDIFPSMYAHHFDMNGRTILHFFTQLVLFLPRHFFTVANSLMYVIMGYLIYKHIIGKEASQPIFFALIFFAMWFYIPAFGETVLWIDGSCNYLWGSVLIFTYLLPFRLYMSDTDILKKKVWIPLMFLGGVIMGWCNENTSAAAIMSIVFFMGLYKINKRKIPMWSITGFLGSLIGFYIMISAPGNGKRIEYFGDAETIIDYILRFKGITEKLIDKRYAWLILFWVFLVTYLIVKNKSWKNLLIPVIYGLAFFVSMYAMMMTPYFPERAMFGAVIYLIITLGLLVEQLEIKENFPLQIAVMACIFMLFGINYSNALYDNAVIFVQYNRREAFIESEIQKGRKDIVVEAIPNRDARTAWKDIMTDSEHWTNQVVKKYYGLDSICIK